MATRIKNIDQIVSSNQGHSNTAKTTVLDYTPVAASAGAIDLAQGNNWTLDASGGVTMTFSNMAGREGQSGNIWITNGADGVSLASGIKKAGDITADHWVSYYVVSSTEVVISVSGGVA